MGISFQVRKWHRWLSLIVGLQEVFWLISGVYMVTVDLDYIHGDQLVRKMDEPLSVDYSSLVPLSSIQQEYPEAKRIRLVSWLGNPHYRTYGTKVPYLIDATTGVEHPMLSEADARRVADYHYAQEGTITSAVLLTDQATVPSEIATRRLPLWQVSFDDAISSNFYISPYDGRLVTRRHAFWRGFDFVWMFHIMDYEAREDVNNNLLRLSAFLGILLAAAGFWLLFYSFRKRKPSELTEGEAS